MAEIERLWSIWVGGEMQARGDGGSGPAMHYAMQYREEGNVIVRAGFTATSPIAFELPALPLEGGSEIVGTPSGLRAVQFDPRYCPEAKGTHCTEWDSSHDLSVLDETGKRYRIGHFKHAHWAEAVGKMIEQNGLPGLPISDARQREG